MILARTCVEKINSDPYENYRSLKHNTQNLPRYNTQNTTLNPSKKYLNKLSKKINKENVDE